MFRHKPATVSPSLALLSQELFAKEIDGALGVTEERVCCPYAGAFSFFTKPESDMFVKEVLMTMISPAASFTPEDLLFLEDEGLFELVDGKLVQKKTGSLANETAVLLSSAILVYLRPKSLGKVYAEQTFQCFPG